MQAYFFFSFENLSHLQKKKKMQRVFPGQESSAPWKFGAPVSQGLAEVTDRAAAEPGRLGFIGPDLSVRRGLQASAWWSAGWWLKVRVTSSLRNLWRLRAKKKKKLLSPPENLLQWLTATDFIGVEQAGHWGFLCKNSTYCLPNVAASPAVQPHLAFRFLLQTSLVVLRIVTRQYVCLHLYKCWCCTYCTAVYVQHCWAELFLAFYKLPCFSVWRPTSAYIHSHCSNDCKSLYISLYLALSLAANAT